MSEKPRAKLPRKFPVAWIYIIVTIAAIMVAVLVSSKNFFNPLNFQNDAIVYLDRNSYLNPMIIRAECDGKSVEFESKKSLYAVIAYARANIDSMREPDESEAIQDGEQMIIMNEGDVIFSVYSQTTDSEPVFRFIIRAESDLMFIKAMPDYPEGETRTVVIKMNAPLREAATRLFDEAREMLENSDQEADK